MTEIKRLDPATRHVRQLEGDYYMLREAAQKLGVSHRTLRNLIERRDALKINAPSFITNFGKIRIYLYTEDDLTEIKEHLAKTGDVLPNDGRRHAGRPMRWTDEERKIRSRLFAKQTYWKSQIRAYEGVDELRYQKAMAKLYEVETALREG